MATKIEIPKGLLVGLAGVAVVAMLGVVFLLGRESGRKAPVETQKEASRMTVAGTVAMPASRQPATDTANALPISGTGELLRPSPSGPAATVPSGAANPENDPVRAAVAAYFQAVDNLQPEASGDPETIAQQTLAGLGKGDMSGFDRMIQQTQTARSRLSAISAPPPCAAYHRESLASLDAGLDLMQTMRTALSSSGQAASLTDLTDRANALKARSEALQDKEKVLKQRYGLLK